MAELRLQLSGISKFFPGVRALNKVDLSVRKGEVHALCGENGAGKSTLMNILTGTHRPDEGKIMLDGREVNILNQQQAKALGIAIVHQERSLVGNLNVAENIFAGHQPRKAFGFIDFKKLYAQTLELLNTLQLSEIGPKTPVDQLSPGQQQMVEIAKALSQQPQILVLDEPSASITETEVQLLFNIVRQLARQGVSVIYISHRMAEIFAIADRVSVLKDGNYQGTREVADISVSDVIRMMVGRDLLVQEYASQARPEVVLETRNFSGFKFNQVNFKLHKGEILGLAGLVGAGRTEVARAIFGADPLLSGEILINGQQVRINHPSDAIALKIGYLPEERKDKGLFLDMSIEDNIVASCLPAAAKKGFLQDVQISDLAYRYQQQLNIVTPNTKQKVMNLSGGNQQKVVLAKWLLAKPAIFMVDEPTHGVDVGAKSEIYQILRNLASQGVAILLISSELPEVLALSDRILVMWNGTLTAELNRTQASEQEIMHYASGLQNMFAS